MTLVGIVDKWVESLDYEYEISTAACVRHKSPHSTCAACVESCPEGAVEFLDDKPSIDSKVCTECGKCLAACPAQAIAGIYPKRKMMQGTLIAEESHIPSAKELLVYYAKGMKAVGTEEDEMEQGWIESTTEANEYLSRMDAEPLQVKTGLSFPKEEERTVSRRELFSIWKQESKTLAKQVAPAKWRFNHTDFDLAKHYRDIQFYSVKLDVSQCSLCRICENLCIKQCFSLQNEQFMISSQSCSDCKLCIDTCPEKAIQITNEIMKEQAETYPVYTKTCASCKKEFKTLRAEEEKCFVCQKRQEGFLTS